MHLLAGLLDFAKLLLNLADLLASIFQFRGHCGLRFGRDFRSDLGGIFHAILESGSHGFEAGGNRSRNSLHFGGALRLRGGETEKVAAQFIHLGFEGFVLVLILGVLDEHPDNQAG